MKLIIDGDVNKYYVQMLCMIYFPGAKFGNDEQETADNPTLELKVSRNNQGVDAYAELRYMHKICSSHKHANFSDGMTHDRTQKIVIGEAVLAAAGELTGYRPSWGMLTGVRPSKVAMEMLVSGMSKTRVKRHMTSDYLVIPKKSALATDVAINEMKIIGQPGKKDCSVYISIPFCPAGCTSTICIRAVQTANATSNIIPKNNTLFPFFFIFIFCVLSFFVLPFG